MKYESDKTTGYLRVDRNTVSKVFSEMQREGHLSCEPGRGTFVSEAQAKSKSKVERMHRLLTVVDEALERAGNRRVTALELEDGNGEELIQAINAGKHREVPIVLITSMSLRSYIQTSFGGEWIATVLSVFPFLLLWGIFFIIYKIAINAEVSTKAAAFSSFVVALVWGVAKNSFVQYVFMNHTYATMYGSFSSLIFFFLWIYVSWIIVIYGMKLCYLINRAAKHRAARHP